MGASALGSRAIIGTFYETLQQAEGQGWIPQIGMKVDSNQESETYKWLGMSPAMREWIGGRDAKGLRENGLTIVNKTYEATLWVLIDEIRRDKTGQVMLRVKEMADRTAAHWASLVTTLIAAGGSTACYDGLNFFSATHSENNSGTLTNLLTSSDYGSLNVGTAAAPTADEMSSIILNLIGHFFTVKDDQGEPMNELATHFLIMVPVNMWGATMTAVKSNLLNTGSGSRDNPLKDMGLSIDVATNPRLTATDVIYAFRTDGRVKPFILQEEEGVKVSAIAEGSEEEFMNRRHLYGVSAIRNVGYGLWQHAIKATLS
jgi:phage major head subunit gpT-like protein